MPYKSDVQRRFFHVALTRGEISKKTVEKYDKASRGKDLPERVRPKGKGAHHHIKERLRKW